MRRSVGRNGKFIKKAEGYYKFPYVGQDSENTTIGYGHVIKSGENFTSLSKSKASKLLKDDVIGKKKKMERGRKALIEKN